MHFYTTRIDRSDPKFAEKEHLAQQIANEIENESSDHFHVVEERGRGGAQSVDEEARFSEVLSESNVRKTQMKSTSSAVQSKDSNSSWASLVKKEPQLSSSTKSTSDNASASQEISNPVKSISSSSGHSKPDDSPVQKGGKSTDPRNTSAGSKTLTSQTRSPSKTQESHTTNADAKQTSAEINSTSVEKDSVDNSQDSDGKSTTFAFNPNAK